MMPNYLNVAIIVSIMVKHVKIDLDNDVFFKIREMLDERKMTWEQFVIKAYEILKDAKD